jgi:hypothetical protein
MRTRHLPKSAILTEALLLAMQRQTREASQRRRQVRLGIRPPTPIWRTNRSTVSGATSAALDGNPEDTIDLERCA